MSLLAITREISPTINDCELSFHSRQRIDLSKAIAQHRNYQTRLAELGLHVIALPAEPDFPDAVFVEDAALITDEIAIVPIMGSLRRRGEPATLLDTLARYRPITFLSEPATLDGGDVLRVGHSVFVGLSRRTNMHAAAQLAEFLHGYQIRTIKVENCLHLKSACSYIGRNTLLINSSLVDAEQFRGFELINVAPEEPAAANVLLISDMLIMPASFPQTCHLLERKSFDVETIDLSELQKAEAGATCSSLIFESASRP